MSIARKRAYRVVLKIGLHKIVTIAYGSSKLEAEQEAAGKFQRPSVKVIESKLIK